jgi:hypothetical protein
MASGWWKSTHVNLDLGSPVDFEVTTAPSAPRNWGKIASVCASGGFYMGGTPCVALSDVIYYAGDDYTQDTDNPAIYRYDGRVSTKVLELPYITGSTPSKAIISLAVNDDNTTIFISTWDSGTTSGDFAGRIYAYNISDGTLTRIDGGLFTTGKLPYALVWFNDALYVGVSKQNPSSTTEVVKLPVDDGGLPGGPASPTATLTGTTYTYEVGSINGTPAAGSFTGNTPRVSVVNRATLNASVYNTLTWSGAVVGTLSYRVKRVAPTSDCIADINPAALTYNDDGVDRSVGAYTDGLSENFSLSVTPVPAQSTTTTYYITAVVDGYEFISTAASCSAPATLLSDLYVALSWSAVTGATSYKVYRSAGHTSTGLIATTTSTSLNDTGLAGTGTVPTGYSTVALTSGGAACAVVYGGDLYIGSNQPASTFGKVFKLTTAGVLSTSQTEAPGGTAGAYNGFTAGIVWNDNLYMSYWNDDATDVALIKKFNGSAWSTVKTISGAGARPGVGFCAADDKLWWYGGGDASTGVLYSTTDGASWTDQSALLPSSKEALPFMANTNVLGGF